ncbi:MAG TPA: TIGR01777 family oxidoreductase [Chitinophagaceae bacterium]|nr:TIGR01777 family oxidoreductase [Chitinophagaceae bacterium]
MATILITGGTGTIGKALTRLLLQHNHQVIILTRSAPQQRSAPAAGIEYAAWNVEAQTIDAAAVQRADYIIHLAGAGVADKRWTSKRKKEILNSRTQSSALLVKALQETPNKVKAIVSASAIGWYGPDPIVPNPKPFEESAPADPGFLGETCRLWEDSIAPVITLDKRLVILRTGIVLSNEGGALVAFKKPLRAGIAAILGSGRQVISWIHVDDLCLMYLRAITDNTMAGVYNAVAPTPVSNKRLTIDLATAVRKNFYIPVYVPSFVLKLLLGQMSEEVLRSATVSAAKIRAAGFNFIYPSLQAALNQLVENKSQETTPTEGKA